jgi:hypothetical protein
LAVVTKLCECGCGRPAPIATRNRLERGQRKGEPLRFVSGHNNNPFPILRGSRSPHWQGDGVGYYGVHVWLQKKHPKTGVCAECGDAPVTKDGRAGTQWAFLHHPGPHTRDISDYRELCRRCHYRLDHLDA